jgi:hypothetical protein
MRATGVRGRFGSRGAVMVEAAVIMPVLLLIIFGGLEFSLAFNANAGIDHAARAGARQASANPKPLTAEDYVLPTRDAVSSAMAGVQAAAPKELYIYEVASGSENEPSGGFTSGCSRCAVFEWDPGTSSFSVQVNDESSWWQPSQQSACPDDADRVGVHITADHDFITGFFSGMISLDSTAVMRLEPFVNGPCGAGA